MECQLSAEQSWMPEFQWDQMDHSSALLEYTEPLAQGLVHSEIQ